MNKVLRHFVRPMNLIIFSAYLVFAAMVGGKIAFLGAFVGGVLALIGVVATYLLMKFVMFAKRRMAIEG